MVPTVRTIALVAAGVPVAFAAAEVPALLAALLGFDLVLLLAFVVFFIVYAGFGTISDIREAALP